MQLRFELRSLSKSLNILCSFITVLVVPCLTQMSEECVCLQRKANSLLNPVYLQQALDENNRFYVAEQYGVIHQYSPSWTKEENSILLDISSDVVHDGTLLDERGLLGFTLHPDYNRNRKLYLYSIRKYNQNDYAYVTEVILGEKNGKYTENVLLAIKQPHHQRNGGQILFGKDNFLYIFVGDGGSEDGSSDAHTNLAQNSSSLLGKILRIDVSNYDIVSDRPQNYRVPNDNPFVNNASWLPEIYAYGCRNMWRCSVDMENEVLPIYTYNYKQFSAVIGGYVYRGKVLSKLFGKYLFADVAFSEFYTLIRNNSQWITGNVSVCPEEMCPCNARSQPGMSLISFGQDNQEKQVLHAVPQEFGSMFT
ncbi:hypothetical protein KUTeg_014457 [Tegillarca granosa]|uniref:Glucose/Sorbosone dehydrogenase domain-containing protein n=1 Tax=Tegillarca granosa TaxID=220873 RepID=A0ABQ9F208_TEGGR|nr:hypothetical protein KUTeg_014457 [Tegillarca granosa]